MPLTEINKKILVDKITDTFIWTFKKGDNIVYNFDILWALYEAKKHYTGNKMLYNKPITLILISIIECILDDFVRRIQNRASDPLPNITQEVIKDFKYKKQGQSYAVKKLEKFGHYINIIEKHKIFGDTQNFYKILHFLRDVRNKIHIQESSVDENRVFTEKNLKFSEQALEIIIKYMVEKYPRCDGEVRADDIPYPWLKI